jgi:hypothetical protein
MLVSMRSVGAHGDQVRENPHKFPLLCAIFSTDEEDEHRWDGFLNGTNTSSTAKSHLYHLHLWFLFPSLIAVKTAAKKES